MGSPAPPRVLITGADLSGLTLAQTLRKNGVPFEIFERDKSDDCRFQGWAIGIHGLRDMRRSFPDDMPPLEPVNHLLPLDLVPQVVVYRKPGGGEGEDKKRKTEQQQQQQQQQQQGGRQRFGVQDDGSGRVIRAQRDRLRRWLATHIPVRWGKRVTGLEEGAGSVTVRFDDGTEAAGDVVVGAEGARSTVRKLLLNDESDSLLESMPYCSIKGEIELRGRDMERQLELGHSAYIVPYEANDGTPLQLFVGLNEVLPCGRAGRYFFNLLRTKDDDDGNDDADCDSGRIKTKDRNWKQTAGAEALHAELRRLAATIPDGLGDLVHRIGPEHIRPGGLPMYTLVLRSLPVGQVTLVGDAAHAMTAC